MRRRVEAKAGDASRGPQLGDRLRGISATTLTRAGHLGLWAVLGLTFLAAAVALVMERYVPGTWYILGGALAGSLVGALRHVR